MLSNAICEDLITPLRSFSSLLILFFFLGSTIAQNNYQPFVTDGEVQTVNANGERFVDYIIPEQPDFDQLILEAVGADGGWIEYQYHDHFKALRSKRVNGGEGAMVTATYSAGYGGSIPPGAILRFVIGNRGHWAKYDLLTGGGYGAGGGGSYINRTNIYPSNVDKVENGNTNNTGDGFIRYKCVKK